MRVAEIRAERLTLVMRHGTSLFPDFLTHSQELFTHCPITSLIDYDLWFQRRMTGHEICVSVVVNCETQLLRSAFAAVYF